MSSIRYVSNGRKAPPVQVMASMNNGLSWQTRELLPGQSYPIPPNCTGLLINSVPYIPRGNYEIRDGKVHIK